MQHKIDDIDKEVGNLDKELAILSNDYKNIAEALNKTNKQLEATNTLLSKFCTKLEKQNVVVTSLQEDFKRYQQYLYGIIVAVIVFIIQQAIMLIH